jgi:excisionase family DNA binding protein
VLQESGVQVSPTNVPREERDDMMTLQAAADLCTVDYETFRRWVAKGVLPHVAIGPHNLKRVYRRDVERLKRDVK